MTRTISAFVAALAVAAAAAAAETARPHVLVTNDDGIDAPGIAALVEAIRGDYRVTVAAPSEDQSGTGHGITYRVPVLVEERPSSDGVRRFAIHAQPATCVRIALSALTAFTVHDPRPVLVLSGINRGDNAGRSTWVSGTLGGAREGALAGLPAVAFSAVVTHGQDPDYAGAARWAKLVLDRLRAAGLPAAGALVKVEIPFPRAAARGVLVTSVGMAPDREDSYVESIGPHGEELFSSLWAPPETDAAGTDVRALAEGWVTVTPLTLDQTDYRGLPALTAVPWGAPPAASAPTP
ncbi:MAG TPA: 5'/3'-nucleotidase SurE [Thermoanaerobaculaceae bacterium]|nr:5'/3'-nucleotidase SurE [Thermoanaerobaculaceae bacterium]